MSGTNNSNIGSNENFGDTSVTPIKTDEIMNKTTKPLSSIHDRGTAGFDDELDVDDIVDEMSIEDLRSLAKRILRVAKEKNDENFQCFVDFLVSQQHHQRQDESVEDIEEDSAKSDSVYPITSRCSAPDASKLETAPPLPPVGTENVEEESKSSDSADRTTSGSSSPSHPEVCPSIAAVKTENIEVASKASNSIHSIHSSSNLLDPSHPDSILSLPPLLRNSRWHDADKNDAAKPISPRKSNEKESSKSTMSPTLKLSNRQQSNSPITPMSPTVRTSNKQRNVEIPMMPTADESSPTIGEREDKSLGKRQLVLLCNRKPSTEKESKDQDLAMILCKNMGVIPSVIVSALSAENSTATKEEQLLVESMPSNPSGEVGEIPMKNTPKCTYPQFFVRSILRNETRDNSNAIIDYMGDYDTMEELYRTGKFDADSLEAIPVTGEQVAIDSTISMKNKDGGNLGKFIDERSDRSQPRTSVGEPCLPSPRQKKSEAAASEVSPLLAQSIKESPPPSRSLELLDNTNNSSGNNTYNSAGSSITDNSSSYKSSKSLNMSMDSIQNLSQIGNAPYSHLDGMNQPKTNQSSMEGFGEMSLGSDVRMIFDIETEVVPIPTTEEANESDTRITAANAAVPTITEGEEKESKTTPVRTDLTDVPSIIEEEVEEEDECDGMKVEYGEDNSETTNDEKERQENVEVEINDEKMRSVPMTVLSTGEIVKQETVLLKRRKPRPQREPPGAVVLNNHSSRLFSEARSSLKSPSSSPVKNPRTLKPAKTESKKIMNPYYALSYYSGGKGDDSAQVSEISTSTDSIDPPGDEGKPIDMDERINPPESHGVPTIETSQRQYLPWEKKFIGIGACYLIFHRNDDELNIHYSESPMANAVGVWTSPDIANFKESQGLSECELIGTCASRVTQDYKNFCHGWCQFIKAAKIMDGTVSAIDGVGLPVEFYLYEKGRTIKVSTYDGEGVFDTKVTDAIACIPKGKDFPATGITGKKWGKIAKKLGGVALFKSLSVKKSKEIENQNEVSCDTNDSTIFPEVTAALPVVEPEPEPVTVPGPESNPAPPHDESLSTLNTFEVVTPVAVTPKSLSSLITFEKSPPILKPSGVSEEVNSQFDELQNQPVEAACYLVYDPDSSGQLVEHYSKTPVEFAIGRWIPSYGKTIAGFKFKRNLGRNVLIGNCSGGVQGRKNFYSGWCQFVRSARNMHGDVTLWDTVEGRKGLHVDVCLYFDDKRSTHQTVRMEEGMAYSTKSLVAVACLPKGTPFFDNMTVDLLVWLAEGSKHGYSSKM